MPKKLNAYQTFLLIGIIYLSSCSAPKALEYKDFKHFTITQLGFTSTSVKMDLIYYNPNNFGLQLKRTDLDIYLDNTYLGHTIQEYQITIPNRNDCSIPIQIEVDMKNLLKNSLTAFFNKQVLVKVTGTVKIGKANIFKSFPVNYEGVQQFTLFK
jgi:LEA14-like dessication related protein